MNRMVCEDCATVYFSAAARTMVQRGERCANCGGRLVLDDGPPPLEAAHEPVGNGEPDGEPAV